jgi:hypothetical protein
LDESDLPDGVTKLTIGVKDQLDAAKICPDVSVSQGGNCEDAEFQ